MRSPHDYNAFLAAKFIMGVFGTTTITIGPLYLADMFFLHQRGRAFNALGLFLNMGASAGPTFSGFITVYMPWYYEYYWTIASMAASIVVVLFFLEDTSWDRSSGSTYEGSPSIKEGNWTTRRIKTFLQSPRTTRKEKVSVL